MKSIKQQSGAVLFISLVILLILTVIGLTSMQNTLFEEKMSAAVRDSHVALEGAEAALSHVELNVIEPLATTTAFDGTGCLYAAGTAPQRGANGLWPTNTWTTGASCVANGVNTRSGNSSSDGSLASPPRYFVEISSSNTSAKENIMVGGYGSNNAGDGTIVTFKVVTLSSGSSINSQRTVSSYYGKRL